MFWFYLFGGIGFLILLWHLRNAWTDSYYTTVLSRIGLSAVGLVLISSMAAFAAVFANLLSTLFIDDEWVVTETNNIRSIADTSKTSGQFFLGSGSIDEQPVFWYYVDLGTQSALREQPADQSYIVETTDGSTPRLVVEKVKSTNTFWALEGENGGYLSEERYTFYVPEGSITNNFELDAKP